MADASCLAACIAIYAPALPSLGVSILKGVGVASHLCTASRLKNCKQWRVTDGMTNEGHRCLAGSEHMLLDVGSFVGDLLPQGKELHSICA